MVRLTLIASNITKSYLHIVIVKLLDLIFILNKHCENLLIHFCT